MHCKDDICNFYNKVMEKEHTNETPCISAIFFCSFYLKLHIEKRLSVFTNITKFANEIICLN